MKKPAPPQNEGTGRGKVKRRRVRVRVRESVNIGWAVIISMVYAVGPNSAGVVRRVRPKILDESDIEGLLGGPKNNRVEKFLTAGPAISGHFSHYCRPGLLGHRADKRKRMNKAAAKVQ